MVVVVVVKTMRVGAVVVVEAEVVGVTAMVDQRWCWWWLRWQ